jgi:glyoxylase-like metal-dependent hydrolase (beta-lactamase superfamily II)
MEEAMRITTHGNYLVQLTRYPRLFPVNVYFVRDDDGLTLIDAGVPGSEAAILAAAAAQGESIRRIIITHAHADHVGSLVGLAQRLPDAEVILSARDARFLSGDMRLDSDEAQPPLRGSYQTLDLRPHHVVVDGDKIGTLRVVASPGHTPGHIALFDERDASLIAGDAFQTRAGLAVSGTWRWGFPFPALATWSRPAALQSARRLAALQPTRLAVGHGDVLAQPGVALERVIAEAANAQVSHGA